MDNTDKKILTYLSEKDWASEAAAINETFKGFDISKEEYVNRLQVLQKKDFVHYQRPFGSGAFVRITGNGRGALKPLGKRVVRYLVTHILEILTLSVAAATLYMALWELVR